MKKIGRKVLNPATANGLISTGTVLIISWSQGLCLKHLPSSKLSS